MMTFRHQCEVRHVLRLRAAGRNLATNFLELVAKKRGEKPALKLRVDSADQWVFGNRGEMGNWIEKSK